MVANKEDRKKIMIVNMTVNPKSKNITMILVKSMIIGDLAIGLKCILVLK